MTRTIAPPLPTISTLHAEIVPHREMAIRRWYSASTLWYYHRRAFPGEYECTRRFYQLIDPELRELCRLLHDAGLHTTPSCQGHFHGRSHFEEVWDELERESRLIQSVGLSVKDAESGRDFLFRASTFELPWSQFAGFYRDAATHQSEGYLGILLPHDRHRVVCALHNQPFRMKNAWIRFDGELSCLLDRSLFGVTVKPRDPNERAELWLEVTRYWRGLLREESRTSASVRPQHQLLPTR